MGLSIRLFKTPVDPVLVSGDQAQKPDAPKPDIELEFGGIPDPLKDERVNIRYTLPKKELVLTAQASSNPLYWNSSGAILSVLDLTGAQAIISTRLDFLTANKTVYPEIDVIELQIAERRSWVLSKYNLTLFKPEGNPPVYVLMFPKTYQQLRSDLEEP
jgi:hypothetical protein